MKSVDLATIRAINRLSVLNAIRRQAEVAQIEISKATKLSTTTLSAITAARIQDGVRHWIEVARAGLGAERCCVGTARNP